MSYGAIQARYMDQQRAVAERAEHIRQYCHKPVIDQGTGQFIQSQREREDRLRKVQNHTIFEGLGKSAGFALGCASNAIRAYCDKYGESPPDEVLAAAYLAAENLIGAKFDGKRLVLPGDMVMESAQDMSPSEGLIIKANSVAMIMPYLLTQITAQMTNFIPGDFNESEIFKVWRVAGSTFNGLNEGDRINADYDGEYGCMDQRVLIGTGDGTKTGSSNEFDLNMNTKFGKDMPVKKKSVRIYHDRNLIAEDNGSGALAGTLDVGGSPLTVTGTVTYGPNGVVHPVFSSAPANGIEIHIGFDVDIETNPDLIPSIKHEMDSRVLRPHESAMSGFHTLQALMLAKREFGLNQSDMIINAMRNTIAADKDRKVLHDLRFFLKGERTWSYTIPTAQYFKEHYETLRKALLEISSVLMQRTLVAGLTGIVADTSTSVLCQALGAPHFVYAPNYRQSAQPHFVGTLFGRFKLFEDPAAPEWESICYAKGRGVGESGYLQGVAIPPIPFNHAVLPELRHRFTLWGLDYRDLNPFSGRDHFIKLRLTSS